ncbi:MAG: dUTP diphosphatase [Bacillota bacterium]|nr:dUTP diphosphatase [Bacillota bacterium]
MSSSIDLSDLYPLQKELDEEIATLHGVSYESTFHRRLLSLLVELGEFANETRCFKYWSLKGPSPKERILDEYADGLHFYLSLGIPLGIHEHSHELKAQGDDLSKAILGVYEKAVSLAGHYDVDTYLDGLGAYLDLLPLLGYGPEEAKKAYLDKLSVNHKRQETHY